MSYLINNNLTSSVKISATTGVDLTIATTTNLYTVPTGKKLVLLGAVLRITAVDTVLVGGTVSIGSNASAYDDFRSAISPSGFDTVDTCLFMDSGLMNSSFYPIYAAGTVIKININVGVTATTCTGAVDLFGYLI